MWLRERLKDIAVVPVAPRPFTSVGAAICLIVSFLWGIGSWLHQSKAHVSALLSDFAYEI